MADKATRISTTNARQVFSDLVNRVVYGKEHVMLTRRGKDLAAVIPVDLYNFLVEVLESAERARQAFQDPKARWYDEEEARQVFLEGADPGDLEGRGVRPEQARAAEKKGAMRAAGGDRK